MTMNPIIALTSQVLSLLEVDNQTQQELVTYTNKINNQAALAREAMDAISQTVVYSQQQAALALKATKAIEHGLAEIGLEEDEYLDYCQMLQHEYLRQMATVVQKAGEAICRQVGEPTSQQTVVYMQIRG